MLGTDRMYRLWRQEGLQVHKEAAAPTRGYDRDRFRRREDALQYAMQFARDMDPELADRFVAMWVNELTLDYTDRGREAVRLLLDEGHQRGLFRTLWW